MDPLTMSLIMGGVQLGTGIWQMFQPKPEQADYEIPFSARQEMMLAGQGVSEAESATRLPGQDIVESNIRQSSAQAMQNIRETAGTQSQALNAATDLADKEQAAFRDLGLQAEQYRAQREDQARRDYMQALGRMSGYEEQQQYMNEIMPAQVAMNEWASTRQSGMQNIMGAVNTAGSAYATDYYNKQMGNWMNTGGQPQTPYGTLVDSYVSQNVPTNMDYTQYMTPWNTMGTTTGAQPSINTQFKPQNIAPFGTQSFNQQQSMMNQMFNNPSYYQNIF